MLVLNAGSSSVKFALFSADSDPMLLLSGAAEDIGRTRARFRVKNAIATITDEECRIADQEQAIARILSFLAKRNGSVAITAVGHRIVHGGPDCDCSKLVTPALEERLKALVPLAPLHMPHNLAGLAAARLRMPAVPQIACFDTAFHHKLPRLATMTPLPRAVVGDEIRRYGFHGLSYEFVVSELRRMLGPAANNERLIVAHLGNGASMAAIRGGRSLETTMGFSTLSGLPMATRCGDIDPGILLYLMLEKDMTPGQLQQMLYEQSGLLGISAASSDMKALLGGMARPETAEAVAFFCARARAYVGALATSLGGIDRLVFTGGIGANSPEIRNRICDGLDFLGVRLDPGRNQRNSQTISHTDSRVQVQAMPTNEEIMIARHVMSVIREPAPE